MQKFCLRTRRRLDRKNRVGGGTGTYEASPPARKPRHAVMNVPEL
jgi:hypothetical protein